MAAWKPAAVLSALALAACATPDMPITAQHASGHSFQHTQSPLGVIWSAGVVLPGHLQTIRPATEIPVSFRPSAEVELNHSSEDRSLTVNAAVSIQEVLNRGFTFCTGEQAPPMDVTLYLIDGGAGFSRVDRGLRRRGDPWRLPIAFHADSDHLIARIARTSAHETFHRWAVDQSAFRDVGTIEEEVAAYLVGYCATLVTTRELPRHAHPPSSIAFESDDEAEDAAPFSDQTLARLLDAHRSDLPFDQSTTAAIYLGLAETLLAALPDSDGELECEALSQLARQLSSDPNSLWHIIEALASDGADLPVESAIP
ncbi:hypothetical protein V0U35_12900 [Hyphobacterium sp. Y6023]|uniref:Peptidase MA-like domain-containing protein n=2 Tax=Hyphobacterium marinum TaxID=3116574 RepID=A0ABU7M186_9PROT|nr:hypothetical protein [Hyphobacterium sp. Y6023]